MKKKRIHFIGIKGVGMTALAIWAKEKGFEVSGSDIKEDFVTSEMLKKFKIPVKNGFERKDIKGKVDMGIVTGAHGGMTNPESMALVTEGIEVLTHGQALGKFMEGSFGISIAGVGGKSTTSAMMAAAFIKADLKPSYVVGVGNILPHVAPGHYGSGKYFIAEADEYASCPITDRTPRFYYQHPKVAVITNIEFDHPDMYANIEETMLVFLKFINNLDQDAVVVLNEDNKNNKEVKKGSNKEVITYGFSPEADYQIEKVRFSDARTYFSLKNKDLNIGEFCLKVPGKYNAQNAAAVVAVGLHLGLSVSTLQLGLADFLGTKRRFELIFQKNNITLYDDYAHHPTEIQTTLLACRQWYPKEKIIVIFQPHTYSRTKKLLADFARCFNFADEVLILPIFASAREDVDLSIDSTILTSEISKFHPKVSYFSDNEKLLAYIRKTLVPGTVIFTMGAGDVYKLDKEIVNII